MGETQACVIGGSITGLVAARVLSDHFDRVIVFDRDTLPAECANRKGVPQGWHGHGLLASGYGALKRLFPQLEHDLLQAGAVAGDVIGDIRWFQHGYYKAKFQSGLGGILLSRPLLETTIRAQVRKIRNVTIIHNAHVHGLLTDAGKKRVSGIRVQQTGGQVTEHPAGLVVDASGRGSRASEWLGEMGYAQPAVDAVDVAIGYTTRTFKRGPRDL